LLIFGKPRVQVNQVIQATSAELDKRHLQPVKQGDANAEVGSGSLHGETSNGRQGEGRYFIVVLVKPGDEGFLPLVQIRHAFASHEGQQVMQAHREQAILIRQPSIAMARQ
jgi:hypothetical protein